MSAALQRATENESQGGQCSGEKYLAPLLNLRDETVQFIQRVPLLHRAKALLCISGHAPRRRWQLPQKSKVGNGKKNCGRRPTHPSLSLTVSLLHCLSVSLEGRKKFHNKRPFFVAFDASGAGGELPFLLRGRTWTLGRSRSPPPSDTMSKVSKGGLNISDRCRFGLNIQCLTLHLDHVSDLLLITLKAKVTKVCLCYSMCCAQNCFLKWAVGLIELARGFGNNFTENKSCHALL